jgi:monoamine oxidase
MPRLSRRSFLAASAALAARPALGALAPTSGPIEIVIVGAGAAGIAAARQLAAAGRRFTVLEASDHIGGRCITDSRAFGVPYDLGAHWIYAPDQNPLARLAPRRSLEVYPAPPSQKVRIGLRNAREGELEDFLTAEVRATRAIADVARKADIACERALPNDLADWRSTVEFVLGPFACAKDLTQVSTVDVARSTGRNTAAFCRQGFGALLAALADGIPVELSTPVTAIDVGRGVEVVTSKGTLAARAVIVTVSTNVLAAGGIAFTPALPHRAAEVFGSLSLGSYDHIALELTGNPLGLESDDLVFEKSTDTHTAALLANASGTSLCLIDVAGSFGRDLAAHGEAAMIDFAASWLGGLYGAEVKKTIGRSHATRWDSEPWTRGAWSAAAPGGASARRVLMEPVADAIWFAGEAAHETLWGTVGGAWESGERAANAVLQKLGPRRATPAEAEAVPKRTPAHAHARVERRQAPTREALPLYPGTPNIMGPER